MHKYTYMCILIYLYIYIYIYVCVCIHICMHTYIHRYMGIYIHTYMRILIHGVNRIRLSWRKINRRRRLLEEAQFIHVYCMCVCIWQGTRLYILKLIQNLSSSRRVAMHTCVHARSCVRICVWQGFVLLHY